MAATSTSFVAEADPETQFKLKIGNLAVLVAVLPISEGANEADLHAASAGLIESLGVVLSTLPESYAPAARKRLLAGIAAELEMVIAGVQADPERAQCLRNIVREPVQ